MRPVPNLVQRALEAIANLQAMVGPTGPPGPAAAWGDLTGTLSDQTDLQLALDAIAGYQIRGGTSVSLAPADSTIYYFGGSTSVTIATHTTYDNIKLKIFRAGTITSIWWRILIGTNGSNEAVSHYLRLNGTTDTSLSTTETYDPGANTAKEFSYTGLSIAVAVGDYIAFKVATPAWATNPTLVSADLSLFIQ